MAKKSISPQQKSLLISFMEEHPQVLKQRQTNQYTNADAAKLWLELSHKLNAVPGAIKEWKEWRKTWSDIKTRTKRKVSENKKQINKTGGGPYTGEIVDSEDDKVLEIMGGDILIAGLNVPEAGLPIPTEQDNQELIENADASPQKTIKLLKTEASTTLNKKAVRPPLKSAGMPRNRTRQITNKAAFDLVKVTQQTNTIQENYYLHKIQILQETLQVQKENLQVQQRIAKGLETFLETYKQK